MNSAQKNPCPKCGIQMRHDDVGICFCSSCGFNWWTQRNQIKELACTACAGAGCLKCTKCDWTKVVGKDIEPAVLIIEGEKAYLRHIASGRILRTYDLKRKNDAISQDLYDLRGKVNDIEKKKETDGIA